MSKKPIAVIGSIDATRTDLGQPLNNAAVGPDAARALGKALAEAEWPIMVYSSTPHFVESYVVQGYVSSGKAKEQSIIMVYPRDRDQSIHGEFAEQSGHPKVFDARVDRHPRWQTSYYQSLPEVEGVLIIGGGNATMIMGLMALANRMPVVSLATFGGSGEEVWAILADKAWVDAKDHQEMGRPAWSDDNATVLVQSFARQRAKIAEIQQEKEQLAEKRQQDRNRRSQRALVYGVVSAALTLVGVFGSPDLFGRHFWLTIYAICFASIPVFSGMAGAMFFTLHHSVNRTVSITEAQAHGFWAGLASAVLFFVSQVTSNRGITNLSGAVMDPKSGLDVLLLFSLIVGFVAGLTYEAVFGKWEMVDVSRAEDLSGGGK